MNPAYVFVIALNYFLLNNNTSYLLVHLLQIFSFSFSAVLICLISMQLFKRFYWISPLIYLAYLPFYNFIYDIWDINLFISFSLLSIYLYIVYFKTLNPKILIYTAIVIGIALLVNPIIAFFAFCFLLHMYIYRKRGFSKKSFLVFIIIPLLIVLPWMIRNYLVHKNFVFIRTGLGINLYLGNNPVATGTRYLKINGVVPKDFNLGTRHHFMGVILREWKPKGYSEYEEDKYLFREFLFFLFNHPLQFIKLFFIKFYYFWWRHNFNPDPNPFYMVEYSIVLVFALYAMIRERLVNPVFNLFYMIFIVYSLFFALTVVMFNWRYRLIITPLLIILASWGIIDFVRRLRNRKHV